jgi:hypothetical protein
MMREIVGTICDAIVASGPNGKPVRVRDVMTDPAAYMHYAEAMAALGVWLTEGRPGKPVADLEAKEGVFVNLRKLKKMTLRGTEVGTWPHLDRTLLLIQDSRRAQRVWGKWRASGIEIPLVGWRAFMDPLADATDAA